MDIKPLSTTSTPVNLPPLESNTNSFNVFNSMNDDTTNLLAEQFRLEREIADQRSIKTQDSFITTYSSLQTILSQMQVKLASVFLQETEYLKQREQRFEQDEQLVAQRRQQLKTIRTERKQFEKEFSKLQDRLETAIVHVINFRTDGVRHFFDLLK
jgi:cell division protein FtsB